MNTSPDPDAETPLPENVPVTMPELPARLLVTTAQQFKAIGDPIRSRILGIIQNQPATAKQIADSLNMAPGTIGHHLQVLETAGLAKVVARRLTHGIVAKYYTRTARIFMFDFPPEIEGDESAALNIVTHIRDEFAESLATQKDTHCNDAFPHARISEERAKVYEERLFALVDDFLHEPFDPNGQVYGMGVTFFLSPPYLQTIPSEQQALPPESVNQPEENV